MRVLIITLMIINYSCVENLGRKTLVQNFVNFESFKFSTNNRDCSVNNQINTFHLLNYFVFDPIVEAKNTEWGMVHPLHRGWLPPYMIYLKKTKPTVEVFDALKQSHVLWYFLPNRIINFIKIGSYVVQYYVIKSNRAYSRFLGCS